MAAAPIYIITDKVAIVVGDEQPTRRLVRAKNKAQAWRHVANGFNVTLASQDDLVAAVGAGVPVEEAKDEDPGEAV